MPDQPVARSKPANGETPVGKVEHYYPKAKAAAVGLTDDLRVGDEIHIVGHGDDVRVKVKSLQLDHTPIAAGRAGQHIGVGLAQKVHAGDDVLLVPAGQEAAANVGRTAATRGAKSAPKPAAKAPKPTAKAAARPAQAPARRSGKAAGKAARKPSGKGRAAKGKGARKATAGKRARKATGKGSARRPAAKGRRGRR